MKGVSTFKYMGRPLNQLDNDWPDIRQNIKQESMIWERLGKLLRREGGDPIVVEMLYREFSQAVLLFDLGTRLILAVMERKVEGTHTVFLGHNTGKRERRNADVMWVTPWEDVVR